MIRNLKLVDLEPAAVMTLRCTAKTVPENPFFASLAAAIDCALENRPDKRAEPQIFVGTTHVGGCDDLHALERAGKLDALLKAP